MKKLLVMMLGASTIVARAQVEPDTGTTPADTATLTAPARSDSSAGWSGVRQVERDSVNTPMSSDRRTASSRSRTRSSAEDYNSTPAGSSRENAGSGKKLHGGKELSLQRALDPKHTRHWSFMSRRATRQNPGAPPGTVSPR